MSSKHLLRVLKENSKIEQYEKNEQDVSDEPMQSTPKINKFSLLTNFDDDFSKTSSNSSNEEEKPSQKFIKNAKVIKKRKLKTKENLKNKHNKKKGGLENLDEMTAIISDLGSSFLYVKFLIIYFTFPNLKYFFF